MASSSSSNPTTIPRSGWSPEPGMLLPDEEGALEERLARVREEKRLALADPGPTWTEWFCYHGAKWYLGGAYLIVFSWEILYLWPPASVSPWVVLPVVGATFYVEYLLWGYLWYVPSGHDTGHSRSTGDGRFRPTPLRLVRYGRWTPESAQLRAGIPVASPETGPDPKEFL